jgi:aspartyl-tRNA(Asn)/glutamyl-tRNA(Gln) amidotransferase subunit A
MAHPLSERSEPPRRADGVDVLLHPTALGEAPILGAVKPDGESEYLQDRLTVPASLAGLPALSVPSGRGRSGWPLGVSLVGQWGSEELLFHIAKQMRSQLCE